MWERIIRFLKEFFGIDPSAVKLGDKIFLPLFYVDANGNSAMTWNYLSKSKDQQKYCRDQILKMREAGETPAICFLLAPSYEAGDIWNPFPVINQFMLDRAIDAITECCWAGIAVFCCLYNDDTEPKWTEISKHVAAWSALHNKIGKFVSAYVLSIESNERAASVGVMQHCIYQMQTAMPGKIVGTHLQWQGAGVSDYKWTGNGSTPANAEFILVEFSWSPDRGDALGLSGINHDLPIIEATNKSHKLIFHEFNSNSSGEIFKQQRERIRKSNQWGVG